MYYGAVIHYRRSRLLNSSTLSLIGVASNLSDGSSRGPRQDNRAVKSAFLSETAIWMQKTENPHFLKSDELWSTCFNTVGMHSGRATRNQKFVGQSSKTAEIWRWERKNRKPPLFRKWWALVHILWNFWKTIGQGYMTPKFCKQKFKNGGNMAMGAKTGKPPLSRKWWTLVHILWNAGLYDRKILWAKVQKRPCYRKGGKKTENPHF